MIWVDVIAGAYTMLTVTLLLVSAVVLWDLRKTWDKLPNPVRVLMLAMGLTTFGVFLDQILWTTASMYRAIGGTPLLSLSAWYAQNIPWVIALSKGVASIGAVMSLWVARGYIRHISLGYWTVLSVAVWVLSMLGVAAVIAMIRDFKG